jgi:hypothetical protein
MDREEIMKQNIDKGGILKQNIEKEGNFETKYR